MLKLYSVYLRNILDENKGSFYKTVEKIGEDSNHDEILLSKKNPYIMTTKGMSLSTVEEVIELGASPMKVVAYLQKQIIDCIESKACYSHNIDISKSQLAKELGTNRSRLDSYLEALSEKNIIIMEDDGSISLSFEYSPYSVTKAVEWHENEIIEKIAYEQEGADIDERVRWIYGRFFNQNRKIYMTDEGLSFDWNHFGLEQYFCYASAVWFGANTRKWFSVDVDRIISEASKHNISITEDNIKAVIKKLCKEGYMKRRKGMYTPIKEQRYVYTDKVVFMIGLPVTEIED